MNDPYLSDDECVRRLIGDWENHGSIVVAYDFDNTVYDYHGKNHEFPGMVSMLQKCRALGFYTICFTAAKDLRKVRRVLNAADVPFDAINKNPPFFKSSRRKIYYNVLLDDRAGLPSAYDHLKKLIEHVENQ